MNAYRLATALVILGAGGLAADDRAGSMTVLPPPPTIMDWHAGNRTWNLEGSRHIHFPTLAQRGRGGGRRLGGGHRFGGHRFGGHGHGHGHGGGIGKHRRGFGGAQYFIAPGYVYPYSFGSSSYYFYSGPGYYPYAPNGLDYATSLSNSLNALNATLGAHRQGGAAAAAGVPKAPRALEIQPSHPQAQARARRFAHQGDENFRAKKYARAYELYRSARRAAPDLPEVHFRIAQTLTALGRYTSAVTAIQRGLRVDPTWPASDFDLNDLYGDDALPLLSHKERLAMALRDDMDNPDLLFLLGCQLFFTGERAQARPFFERAMQLTGDPSHIVPFLEVPVEASAEPDAGRNQADDAEEAPAPPPKEEIPRNGTRREI